MKQAKAPNMKQEKALLHLTLLIAFIASCQDSQKSNLALLSDQVPIDSAMIFAPGIIATDAYEFSITFNPEMDELLFTRRKPEADNEIYSMRFVNGSWSEPEVAFFKADDGWDFEPHINPMGDRLYFGSLRALPDSAKRTELHQWYCEKILSGWSQPKPLSKPFINQFVMYLTSAENGNLYFTSGEIEEGSLKDEGIYYSIFEDGKYGNINKMGKEINVPGLESIAHPYIAPDESYIIFDGKSADGFGSCDLYISFNIDGTWTEARNLGPLVNTEMCEMTASVSPDGKYLFFHRGAIREDKEIGNIYWVDFELIKQQLKQNNNQSYFGQSAPGMKAEIFAPGMVSVNGRYEYAVSFSPSLDEMYFTGEKEGGNQKVYFSKHNGKEWTKPKVINLTKGKKNNEFEAFVNSSGNMLFFAAYDSIFSDERIWYTKRQDGTWAEAEKLDSPINDDLVFYPNTAGNGDLYYTSISKKKMQYAPYQNGRYREVHEVEIEFGIHGFISPAQDFILLDAPKGNDPTRDRDIYVCFKKQDGSWSKPIALGNGVNTAFDETCPSITPDGKYLFFSRYDEKGGLSNIFWVRTEVIGKVKPVDF